MKITTQKQAGCRAGGRTPSEKLDLVNEHGSFRSMSWPGAQCFGVNHSAGPDYWGSGVINADHRRPVLLAEVVCRHPGAPITGSVRVEKALRRLAAARISRCAAGPGPD